MTSENSSDLAAWRASMLSDLQGPDIGRALRALLELTYDDPDRRRVEEVLLRCSLPDVDVQIRALAVTCMGHIGRIHRAVSVDVKRRIEDLISDPVLGGQAEDALDDIQAFASSSE